MEILPLEIITEIFFKIDLKGVVRSSRVSKWFQEIVDFILKSTKYLLLNLGMKEQRKCELHLALLFRPKNLIIQHFKNYSLCEKETNHKNNTFRKIKFCVENKLNQAYVQSEFCILDDGRICGIFVLGPFAWIAIWENSNQLSPSIVKKFHFYVFEKNLKFCLDHLKKNLIIGIFTTLSSMFVNNFKFICINIFEVLKLSDEQLITLQNFKDTGVIADGKLYCNDGIFTITDSIISRNFDMDAKLISQININIINTNIGSNSRIQLFDSVIAFGKKNLLFFNERSIVHYNIKKLVFLIKKRA